MGFLYKDDTPWGKDLEKLAREVTDLQQGASRVSDDAPGHDPDVEQSKCYLQIAGASGEAIAGEALGSEVHNEAAKDLVRIDGWSWGLGIAAEHVQSESYSRGAVSPEVFKFEHQMDQSTPTLLAYLSAGLKFQALKFKEYRSTSKVAGGQFQLALLIELTDCFVVRADIGNRGGAVPGLEVELMFDTIAVEYYPFSPEGVRLPGAPRRYQWKPQQTNVMLNGRPFQPG